MCWYQAAKQFTDLTNLTGFIFILILFFRAALIFSARVYWYFFEVWLLLLLILFFDSLNSQAYIFFVHWFLAAAYKLFVMCSFFLCVNKMNNIFMNDEIASKLDWIEWCVMRLYFIYFKVRENNRVQSMIHTHNTVQHSIQHDLHKVCIFIRYSISA